MKKLKLIGAVGGAISLALCWPLAVGQIGQNVITDGVAYVNSKDMSAELISYDRGYLSSHVQTRYSVTNPALKQQLEAEGFPSEIVMDSEVSHGLLGISATSTFPEYPDSPLVIYSTTQLNGTTSYKTTLEDWHYLTQGPDALAISILSSEIKGKITTLGEASYEASIPSVAMNFSTGEKVLMSNLSGKGHGKKDSGFWIGQQSVDLERITADDGAGYTLFDVENSSYVFESSLDPATSRFTSNHHVKVEKFFADNTELQNIEANFTLGDVDSESFLALSNIYQSNPSLGSQDIQQAVPHVDSLFSKGFFVAMDPVRLNVGDGEFSSKFTVNVPEGTTNVPGDPGVLLPALTGGVEAFVSNQLVSKFPAIQQGVDELMVMEMVTQKPEGYQFNADIKEGNLVFSNGQKVPLIALFMSAVMSRGY